MKQHHLVHYLLVLLSNATSLLQYSYDGGSACAGVAWASCVTPEGDECAIVATISTELDYEETSLLLRRNLQRRLASRDLEVISFDVAVDEVTAGAEHHGVAMAALILPNSLSFGGKTSTGPIRVDYQFLWTISKRESMSKHQQPQRLGLVEGKIVAAQISVCKSYSKTLESTEGYG